MESLKRQPVKREPAQRLAYAAIGCWLLSLVLPGFMVGDSAVWLGFGILIAGLIGGWAVMGWAVYANLLFFLVLIFVMMNKPARKSIFCMLLLVATLPFFHGIPSGIGIGSVTAWGWGALVWLTALFLAIAASGLQEGWFTMRQIRRSLAWLYALVASLHIYQWTQANIQEREMYLLNGAMVFTVVPFCGVSLTWPERQLIEADEFPELDIDTSLNDIRLPDFERWRSDGFAWVKHTFPWKIKVRYSVPPSPPSLSFQTKATEHGAVIRLVQNVTGQVLYEQELRRLPQRGNSYHHEYCPGPGLTPKHKGYQRAILRALGQQTSELAAAAPRAQLQTEIAFEPCDIGEQDIDGIKGLRMWDGRQVILGLNSRARGFCSKTYIATAAVRKDHAGLMGSAQVFDRRTLQPLAIFVDRVCDKPCTEAERDIITGIQIADENVTIKTIQGDAQSRRRWK